METNQTPLINRNLIETTGKNLRWIGYLILTNVLVSCWMKYSISNSLDIEEIKRLTDNWIFISLISVIVIGILFIFSGQNLRDSLSQPNENYGKLNKNSLNFEGVYFETECFPNGKIKIEKSFNKEGLKHGFWKYYLENGERDYTELYQDGNLIQRV